MIKIIAKIVLISLLFSFKMAEEPLSITWKNLQDVRFKKKYFEDVGMVFLVPSFGESVKKMEGKEVIIKGYMIPTDVSGETYVISANPMSFAFFVVVQVQNQWWKSILKRRKIVSKWMKSERLKAS